MSPYRSPTLTFSFWCPQKKTGFVASTGQFCIQLAQAEKRHFLYPLSTHTPVVPELPCVLADSAAPMNESAITFFNEILTTIGMALGTMGFAGMSCRKTNPT